jgi:hypothetical protein
MKKFKLPKFDSIQELAQFWDSHDLTDFEDQLREVKQPVFVRGARASRITVPLTPRDARIVQQIAEARGLTPEELLST